MATITLYSVSNITEKKLSHQITGQIKKQIKSKLDDSIGEIADAIRPKGNEVEHTDNPALHRLNTIKHTIEYAKELGASRADRVFVWSTDKGVVETVNGNSAELQKVAPELVDIKTELGVRVGYQDPEKKNKFVEHAHELLGVEIQQTKPAMANHNNKTPSPLEILNDVKNKTGYNDRQNG
jgi:hypothetical protein